MNLKMESIEFRATKDGPILQIKELSDHTKVEQIITLFLQTNSKFFEGADFINLSVPNLPHSERNTLLRSLEEQFEIRFNLLVQREKISEESTREESKKEELTKVKVPLDQEEYKPSKFIRNTLRSGALIEFDGNIIVFGDVNPGAQLIASGNILVMGYLKGIAHAGSKGDVKAFVAANRLEPIQLRIANFIAISPEKEYVPLTFQGPQMAYVSEEAIIIEERA